MGNLPGNKKLAWTSQLRMAPQNPEMVAKYQELLL